MKNLVYILTIVVFAACSNTKSAITTSVSDSSYLIKKIKKKRSWYIIYAERKDTLYKITSRVNSEIKIDKNYKKIHVGKRYEFKLDSRRDNLPVFDGIRLQYVSCIRPKYCAYLINGLECYSLPDDVDVCTDPARKIYDIYTTDDLNGRYYLKQKHN